MDVTLPDGTIVKGIPEGTTKAQLATKLRGNGMTVPDSWMQEKPGASLADQVPRPIGATPESAKNTPEAPEPLEDKIGGMYQAARRTVYGIPIGFAAGLADAVHANGIRDSLDRGLQNAAPLGQAGQRYMGNIQDFLRDSKIEGMAPEFGTVGRLGEAVKLDAPMLAGQARRVAAPALEAAGNATSKAADAAAGRVAPVLRAPGAGMDMARGAISDIRGTQIPPARQAAANAAREAIEGAAEQKTGIAGAEAARAKTLDAIRARLDQHLSQRTEVPNLDEQGSTLSSAMKASYEAAKKARQAAADSEFGTARQAAQAKEATGARIDTSAIQSELEKMKADANGIPDLEAGINRMSSAISGRAPKPEAPVQAPNISGKYKAALPPSPPVEPELGKTFSQLELSRRYFSDIAYSGALEGYPAIIRNRAREISNMLDKKMQEFVPEFKQYKENYAKNSDPLHSLDTRFGKAITSTEGGLKADAYSKVAPQDLPNRLFSKKEGIDLVVDALSGGKNAAPEARAAAEAQVSHMVENWILSDTKELSGEKAVAKLRAPQMEAALSAVPKVAQRLTSKFESRAALEARSTQLAADAKAAQGRAAQATEAANKMKTDIEMADTLNAMPDASSKEKAFQGYMNALARERSAGLIDPAKYKATMELVSRANTLAERTRLARKIAGRIAGLGTAIFVGSEVIK